MALNLGPLNVLLRLQGGRKFQSEMGNALGAIKGLAAGYASLAGAAKAFDLSREAAKAADAIAIFRHAGGDLDGFRESVRGTVSDFELVKKANLARIMGIPAEAMGTLAQAAMAASSATGESVDFMLDSIVRGVARGSPLILDNLGIIISIGEANEEYARKLGKTAEALTKAESAQAVLNATLKAVKPQIEAANAAGANSAEIYQRMSAQVDNLSVQFGQALLPAMASLLPVLVDVAKWMGYLITGTTPEMQAEEAVSSMADEVQNLTTQLDKARRQLKGLEEAKLSGTVAEHIQTVLPGLRAYSEEAAFGALEMQIADFEEKIAALQKRARGGGRRAAPTPTPTRTAAAQTGAAQPFDAMAATQDLFKGLPTFIGTTEMSFDEFNELLDNGTEIIIDHTEALERQIAQTEKITTSTQTFDKFMGRVIDNLSGMAQSVISGNLGATAGPALGQTIGAAIGAAFAMPQVGAAIGSAAGQIFGPLFDVVADAVGVFEPFIDIINRIAAEFFTPILVGLAPSIESMARVFGAILIPAARTLGDIFGVVEFVMSNFRIAIENLVTAIGNVMSGNIIGAFTDGMKEFVSYEDYIDKVNKQRAAILADLNGTTESTTERFRELNEELTNIPLGVKRLRLLQYGATRGQTAFPNRFNAPAWGA